MMTDRDLLEQIGKLRLRVKELEGQMTKPMTDKTTLPEPVAYRVHDMMVPRMPVKAKGKFETPSEYLYPADRASDAKDMAQMLRAECDALYTATALQEALDRAGREHSARRLTKSSEMTWRSRCLTAEAALESARKAFNHIDALDPEEHVYGCSAEALRGLVIRMGQAARQWLSANQKETPNADK